MRVIDVRPSRRGQRVASDLAGPVGAIGVHDDQFAAVDARDIERLIGTARAGFSAVVVDGGSTLDERTRVLLAQADQIVLPLYPEIAALKALHSLLDTLVETGTPQGSMTFVLNHLFAREMLKVRDIENTLASSVTVELPFDPIVYLKAVNEGVPVVLGSPRTAPARAFEKLVDALVARPTEAPQESDERSRRGIAALLKRG